MKKINFPLLQPQEIEVKVKQVTKTGALLLLYKTARTDAKILDDVLGPLNWTNENVVLDGVLYCKVGVRLDEGDEFVWKMDCGVESAQEDGQEKKAESSDSFKRACSRLGIGRELYTSPAIWASVATEQDPQNPKKWYLKDRNAKYIVTDIKYNESSRTIIALTICNARTGVRVFNWELPQNEAMRKKMNKIDFNDLTDQVETSKIETTEVGTSKVEETAQPIQLDLESKSLDELKVGIGQMAKVMRTKDGNINKYKEIVKTATGVEDFKCNKATEEDKDKLINVYKALVEGGYNG